MVNPKSEEHIPVTAQMPRRLRDDLRRLAGEHDRSVSAEVRSAIRLHLRTADGNDVDREPPPEAV